MRVLSTWPDPRPWLGEAADRAGQLHRNHFPAWCRRAGAVPPDQGFGRRTGATSRSSSPSGVSSGRGPGSCGTSGDPSGRPPSRHCPIHLFLDGARAAALGALPLSGASVTGSASGLTAFFRSAPRSALVRLLVPLAKCSLVILDGSFGLLDAPRGTRSEPDSGFWLWLPRSWERLAGFFRAGMWANLMMVSRFFPRHPGPPLLFVVAPQVEILVLSSPPTIFADRFRLDFLRWQAGSSRRGRDPLPQLSGPVGPLRGRRLFRHLLFVRRCGSSEAAALPRASVLLGPSRDGGSWGRTTRLDDGYLGRRDFADLAPFFDRRFGFRRANGRRPVNPGLYFPRQQRADVVFATVDFRRLTTHGSAGRSPRSPSCLRHAGRSSLSPLRHRSACSADPSGDAALRQPHQVLAVDVQSFLTRKCDERRLSSRGGCTGFLEESRLATIINIKPCPRPPMLVTRVLKTILDQIALTAG